MRSVLVTGATGGVGSELVRQLAARPDVAVTGTSASGGTESIGWRIGAEPPPTEIERPWDVVVHSAASTRWTMTPQEAIAANVNSLEDLRPLVREGTRLVHLSTAHAIGRRGTIESNVLSDYRNTYEWSKAASERLARSWPNTVVARFPIVFGRSYDGYLARHSGMFKLVSAIASGLAPAVVAIDDAPFDIVAVDELCAELVVLVEADDVPDLVRLGGGSWAPSVEEVLDLAVGSLNAWREGQGIEPLDAPPLIPPERWHRFFLPFAREHLSPLQVRTIDLLGEFEEYLCMTESFPVDRQLPHPAEAIERTITSWAELHPAAAGRRPMAWR